MRFRFLLLSTLLIATGCTHQKPIHVSETDRLTRFNERTADRTATVVMQTGVTHTARSLHVAADSTSWLDSESGRVVSVATSEVTEVRSTSRGRGALNGLITGALLGTAVGVFVGVIESQGGFLSGLGSSEPPSAGEAILTEGARLGGIGGLIGLAIGGTVGSEVMNRFDARSRPEIPDDETTGGVFRESGATPDG